MLISLAWAFISAVLISFVVSMVVIYWYRQQNWLDDPQKQAHNKIVHITPVPRGGGVPIFISLLIVGSLFLQFDKHFLGILSGALILTLVGVLDDVFDLNPYLRLVTGVVAASCVVAAGIGIAYVTNPLVPDSVIHLDQPQISFPIWGETRSIWVVADIFALIWIVWMMNMVNWSKGVDGQMPGFVSLAAIFLGLFSLRFAADVTQWQVTLLAAIVAGSFLGLLFWNAYPQKIMPGYGGGSLGGYLLAVLSILSGAKVAVLILVVAIPMLDAVYTIIRRIAQGKSPVWGDRGHLHHRLLDLGWSKKKIAYFYWLSTISLGIISLFLNSGQKIFSLVMLALVVGGGIFGIQLLNNTRKKGY